MVLTPPPVELFQLVLTDEEACVLYQMFSVGTRALKTTVENITSAVVAHMHIATKHPKAYETLGAKLGVLADWHNANQDTAEAAEAA